MSVRVKERSAGLVAAMQAAAHAASALAAEANAATRAGQPIPHSDFELIERLASAVVSAEAIADGLRTAVDGMRRAARRTGAPMDEWERRCDVALAAALALAAQGCPCAECLVAAAWGRAEGGAS